MPGSSHVQVKKKHMVTIIGGFIATIIGAATPGFLSWMEQAGERAEQSQEVAEHASVKSDIAYKQVWTQLQFIQSTLQENREDMRSLTQRVNMLYQGDNEPEMPHPVRTFRMAPKPSSRRSELDDLLGAEISSPSGHGPDFEDSEDGLGSDPLGSVFEDEMEPQMQQMILPEQLDEMAEQQIEQEKADK